jgi:hypothetical protein
VVVGILAVGTPNVHAEESGRESKLNHFRIYKVDRSEVREEVSLKGQFDKEPVGALLTSIDRFANPASMNGGEMINQMSHLTWYSLRQAKREPRRDVEFENEFGKQKVRLGKAVALLVPTKKIEDGSEIPQGLDHYKVYDVLDHNVLEQFPVAKRRVKLQDQFSTEDNLRIGRCMFFAVPVSEQHGEKLHPISNQNAHLTIHTILRTGPKKVYEKIAQNTIDQLGNHLLSITESEMLALPTVKTAWSELGVSDRN